MLQLDFLIEGKDFLEPMGKGLRLMRQRLAKSFSSTAPFFNFFTHLNDEASYAKARYKKNTGRWRENLYSEVKNFSSIINLLKSNENHKEVRIFVRWFHVDLQNWLASLEGDFLGCKFNDQEKLGKLIQYVNKKLNSLVNSSTPACVGLEGLNGDFNEFNRSLKTANGKKSVKLINNAVTRFRQLIEKVYELQAIDWFRERKAAFAVARKQLLDLTTSNLVEQREIHAAWKMLDMLVVFDDDYKEINCDLFGVALGELEYATRKKSQEGVLQNMKQKMGNNLDSVTKKITHLKRKLFQNNQELLAIERKIALADQGEGWLDKLGRYIRPVPIVGKFLDASIRLVSNIPTFLGMRDANHQQIVRFQQDKQWLIQANKRSQNALEEYQNREITYKKRSATADKKLNAFDKTFNKLQTEKLKAKGKQLSLEKRYHKLYGQYTPKDSKFTDDMGSSNDGILLALKGAGVAQQPLTVPPVQSGNSTRETPNFYSFLSSSSSSFNSSDSSDSSSYEFEYSSSNETCVLI